ncbi:MAG TPA: CoB--CoM heterodisulfide reductase subunit B [Candidatus Bathyarchaeia archaeon]|nr:CoB--CoM heterodisulfide reductase subunit B [Candidatus Bathyarchaeia archaeon]
MSEETKEYAFFPGCITPNRYPGIEAATKKIFNVFGIETKEMEGASCCPAPGVFGSFDMYTWLPIAARNLAIAEEMGLEIYVTCNGCYGSLQEADHLLKENPKLKEKVNVILSKAGREYKGTTEVHHAIVLLRDVIGLDRLKEKVTKPMKDVNVAIHYGCHFLKPSEVRGHGSSETPYYLEDIVKATGAKEVLYKDKLMCCGAGGGVRTADTPTALEWARQKLVSMIEAGADCVIHPCAFCHLQLDRGQYEMNEAFGTSFDLPVLHAMQFTALAMGFSEKELALDQQTTKMPEKLLK